MTDRVWVVIGTSYSPNYDGHGFANEHNYVAKVFSSSEAAQKFVKEKTPAAENYWEDTYKIDEDGGNEVFD